MCCYPGVTQSLGARRLQARQLASMAVEDRTRPAIARCRQAVCTGTGTTWLLDCYLDLNSSTTATGDWGPESL